jgi:hypothetical protein
MPFNVDVGVGALGSSEILSSTPATLSETVTINSTAGTIEQAGTIAIGAESPATLWL